MNPLTSQSVGCCHQSENSTEPNHDARSKNLRRLSKCNTQVQYTQSSSATKNLIRVHRTGAARLSAPGARRSAPLAPPKSPLLESHHGMGLTSGVYQRGWETDLPRFQTWGSFFLPGNDSLGMGRCGDEGAAARTEEKNIGKGWGSPTSRGG